MVSRTLPGLGLHGFWLLGEDGWNTGADDNWRKLSVAVQTAVLAVVAAVPPMPEDGAIYLLANDAAANARALAVRDAGAWVYLAPNSGWLVWDVGGAVYRTFDGANWNVLETGSALPDLTGNADKVLGVNAGATAVEWVTRPTNGEDGEPGTNGEGVPLGGTAGQQLVKVSGNDFDTTWADAPEDGGIADAPTDGKAYWRKDAAWIAADLPYDVALFCPSVLAPSKMVMKHVAARDYTLPIDFAASRVNVGVNPSAAVVLAVKKGVVEVGTISIATSGVVTLTAAAATILAAGDVLRVDTPADTFGLTDLSITFAGAR